MAQKQARIFINNKTNIYKNDDARASFAISLNSNKYYSMPADKCDHYFHPLAVGCFNIFYISVPNLRTKYIVDVNTFLK